MMDDLLTSRTPVTPPTTEAGRLAWLRLIRSFRVGPTTFHRLLSEHGSADAALAALPAIAAAAGVSTYNPCSMAQAQREMADARRIGAQMICYGSPAYPASMLDLSDAPPILWAIGDAALLSRPMVALVGARNASSLGVRMAKKLAASLAEAGFVVVSGLARGIDAAAHEASLSRGTVAVMAGGVDVIYPAENAVLAGKIAQEGLRLSEQPVGLEPQARHFPMRNRIISGLAQAVVVVEAAARSGSLITARDALDQGREVMAVPGHPFDGRAAGCNMLIRDGATLVRDAADVLEAMRAEGLVPVRPAAPQPRVATPPATAPASAPASAPATARTAAPAIAPASAPGPSPATARSLQDISTLHSRILSRLGPSPLAEDQLIRDLAMPAALVAPELLNLELDGQIIRQPGGLLSRAS